VQSALNLTMYGDIPLCFQCSLYPRSPTQHIYDPPRKSMARNLFYAMCSDAYIQQVKMNVSASGVQVDLWRIHLLIYSQRCHISVPCRRSAQGLYTTNATAPLEEGQGLRQIYAWGFYSHCAYVAPEQGICSNKSQPSPFQPFDTVVADAPAKFHTVAELLFNSGLLILVSWITFPSAYWLCSSDPSLLH